MRKAIHIGSCQACSGIQKLPGGVLSKHGYHVRWRMFVGECPGTGHKPYEQDCSLIQKYIDDVKKKLVGVGANIEKNLQPATEPKCWYHEYVGGKHMPYQWREVELIAEARTVNYRDGDHTYYDLLYINHKGTKERYPVLTTDDVLKTATKENTKYVQWELEPYKKSLERYIRWQQERVDKWVLKELKPVPPEQPKDPNRVIRRRWRW